jgi:TnpA family transposase
MSVESNYVDSHGASFIGFGITRLLDFDLIARFKQINQMKLYLPGKGDTGAYPLLQPALTRPVRWDIIEPQYDSMIKYATAIRLGTASTEAILRRFTKDVTHPAYAAMLETGRAQRTIFLARWLRDRDLQRETSSGLNVVENYNGVAVPDWAGVLGDADRRGLTPLFHANMTPYGEVQLRMDRCLHLTAAPQADAAGEARQASGSPA